MWRHYLGRLPKLFCINLDVLGMMNSVHLSPLRRVLDRHWCSQKPDELQIMCLHIIANNVFPIAS